MRGHDYFLRFAPHLWDHDSTESHPGPTGRRFLHRTAVHCRDWQSRFATCESRSPLQTTTVPGNFSVFGTKQMNHDPLHQAIRDDDVGALRALLSSGHDANVENFDGMVPLSTLALSSGSIMVAKLLLDAGADPNGNQSLLPPLVMAASQDHKDLVALLLESGADPNIVDEEENTALMYALICKDCDLALRLLSFGAHPRQVNRYGSDAKFYAEQAQCRDVLECIANLLKLDVRQV
jgi:ankyrin repeat protein